MTIAIFSAAMAVAWVALTMWLLTMQAKAHREAQVEWALERRELLNRIQHPEFVPTTPAQFELPEQEPDEWNLVGTIAPPPEDG